MRLKGKVAIIIAVDTGIVAFYNTPLPTSTPTPAMVSSLNCQDCHSDIYTKCAASARANYPERSINGSIGAGFECADIMNSIK